MTSAQLYKMEDIRNYITGAQAMFTLVSKDTGNRYSYRAREAEGRGWFIDILTGPDNNKDYSYAGFMFITKSGDLGFKFYEKINKDSQPANVIRWFIKRTNVNKPMKYVEFWHSGKCSRCGRLLTTPESIERGLGPVCAERV